MKKVKRVVKRSKMVHVKRVYPARHIRVRPDPKLPYEVCVHVSRTRRHMHNTILRWGRAEDPRTQGCVYSQPTRTRQWEGRLRLQRGGWSGPVVATMFLNVKDLRRAAGLIISHESTHAAMAWARYKGVDVQRLPIARNEEFLADAVGELTQQLTNRLWSMGALR